MKVAAVAIEMSKLKYCIVLLICMAALPLLGAPIARGVPEMSLLEHYEVRRDVEDILFAPLSELQAVPGAIYRQSDQAQRVRLELRSDAEALYLLFLNEEQAAFPLHGRGSYIIKRSRADGTFRQIKIFLTGDSGYYARIFPRPQEGGNSNGVSNETSGGALMDIYLAEMRVYHSIPIPMSLEELLLAPFAEIVRSTARVVEWALLLPATDPHEYRHTRSMVTSIRKLLPTLPDAEDGAMDSYGNLVRIDGRARFDKLPGFNCSGFAKWVADGLYFPATGRYLDLERLARKHLRLRGTRWSRTNEDARDPYFGLDWTRNIGAALYELEYGYAPRSPESTDVRTVPFVRYVEDVGYPVGQLEHILYLLAIREPGTFYFGSINGEWGSAPTLRQHFHVVVLFPYFDSTGSFRVAVLERNVESDLSALRRRYPQASVHLVRAQATANFAPPLIEQLGDQ